MLFDSSSKNELKELQLKLNAQQELIEKQKCDILTLTVEKQRHTKQEEVLYAGIALMGKMTSILAHEINQPLTAISAYTHSCLHLVRNKLKQDKIGLELAVPLERVIEQAGLSGIIVNEMITIMQDDFSIEITDIHVLIEETLSILRCELPDVKWRLNVTANIPQIMTNKMTIMRVILNLVRNRVDVLHSALNPEMLIEIQESNEHIVIQVSDNGPNLSEQINAARLNADLTPKTEGTGIGLRFYRALIESLGGVLNIQEKKAGIRFSFTLPI